MSLRTSCSCSAIVPVEMTTFLPLRSAGTRYASDLPTPVPASTIVCAFSRKPRSINLRHLHLARARSKPGSARAIGPSGAKTASIASRAAALTCGLVPGSARLRRGGSARAGSVRVSPAQWPRTRRERDWRRIVEEHEADDEAA